MKKYLITKITGEGSRLRENGNFLPCMAALAQEHMEHFQPVNVWFEGAEYGGLRNVGDGAVTLRYGYKGGRDSCDNLTVHSGEVIIRTSKGNAYAFSEYRIGYPQVQSRADLREILENLPHEGMGNGLMHTHWRVYYSKGELSSEEVCVNQYGSVYGNGRFASLKCIFSPSVLGSFSKFIDIKV